MPSELTSGTTRDRTAGTGAGPQVFTLRYFAWVREKVGRAEETIEIPAGLETVGDLVGWLAARGPEYADAFLRPGVVRTAIDHVHVKHAHPIRGAREIAFFPPVTGG